MAKEPKAPERTREEMAAFFEAHEGFNDYISKKIMAREKAKRKKNEDAEVKDAMGIKED